MESMTRDELYELGSQYKKTQHEREFIVEFDELTSVWDSGNLTVDFIISCLKPIIEDYESKTSPRESKRKRTRIARKRKKIYSETAL